MVAPNQPILSQFIKIINTQHFPRLFSSTAFLEHTLIKFTYENLEVITYIQVRERKKERITGNQSLRTKLQFRRTLIHSGRTNYNGITSISLASDNFANGSDVKPIL